MHYLALIFITFMSITSSLYSFDLPKQSPLIRHPYFPPGVHTSAPLVSAEVKATLTQAYRMGSFVTLTLVPTLCILCDPIGILTSNPYLKAILATTSIIFAPITAAGITHEIINCCCRSDNEHVDHHA